MSSFSDAALVDMYAECRTEKREERDKSKKEKGDREDQRQMRKRKEGGRDRRDRERKEREKLWWKKQKEKEDWDKVRRGRGRGREKLRERNGKRSPLREESFLLKRRSSQQQRKSFYIQTHSPAFIQWESRNITPGLMPNGPIKLLNSQCDTRAWVWPFEITNCYRFLWPSVWWVNFDCWPSTLLGGRRLFYYKMKLVFFLHYLMPFDTFKCFSFGLTCQLCHKHEKWQCGIEIRPGPLSGVTIDFAKSLVWMKDPVNYTVNST